MSAFVFHSPESPDASPNLTLSFALYQKPKIES